MGRVVAVMGISLDGFIEGPDGDISWHRVDEALHQEMNDALAPMGPWLFGRRVYQLLEGFWPGVSPDTETSPAMLQYAELWRTKPKVVFSRTLEPADPSVRVLREVDPAEVAALKAETDGDLALGGAGITDAFAQQGLVDEYRVYIHPVAIGRGTPYFSRQVDLELLDTQAFGNGVVRARYRPV